MSKFNCYDTMILSAGSILLPPCDLNYYFLKAFSIKYYKGGTSEPTYDEIIKNDSDNSILRDYYGFCVTNEKVGNKTLAEKKIEDITLNKLKPIGIIMDSFYIPWSNLQFQLHRMHCFLITDVINDKYICVDKFLSENKVCIDKKTLIDNVKFLFYFNYDKKIIIENDLNSLISFIKEYISVEQKEHIEKLKGFSNDILNMKFDTMQDISLDNIEESNLIFFIANVGWSRMNFLNALKLLKSNFNTSLFDNIIPIIDELYVMWGKVKSLMIKNVFTNSYYQKASQLVQTIADKENKVMELILNIRRISDD